MTTPEEIAQIVASTVKAMQGTTAPAQSEWELAEDPMESDIILGNEVGLADYESRISKPTDTSNKKTLQGFPTGTLLDDLFLDHENNSIGGIPITAQMAMTGLAGSGKSILISEIALKAAASGRKVMLVTSEDVFTTDGPRFDLQSRLMTKADILEIDWSLVKDNLFVLDAVTNSNLRHWKEFAETYRYACRKYGIELALIDSITMLEESRGSLKYRLMELCRYNQDNGITMIAVNQRTKETWDAYEMAGGHAIAHAVDGTILVDYGRTYHPDQVTDLGKRGTSVRMVRVMDCRLCGFNRDRIPITITNQGFVRKLDDVVS